jgi:hypothetical protein
VAVRLEIELTSARGDGTWTWRAAGARQPKGELDGSLLAAGAKVGDVVRVEAEQNNATSGAASRKVVARRAASARPVVSARLDRRVARGTQGAAQVPVPHRPPRSARPGRGRSVCMPGGPIATPCLQPCLPSRFPSPSSS